MNEEELTLKEEQLKQRIEKITSLEKEIREREKALKAKENEKKQIVLRLSKSLWDDISAWAEEDFRSINSQIEYLLTECVKKRHNK